MSTPDIIAARAAGGLVDTPWNTVVTELCRRVIALEKARGEGVLLESVVIDTGATEPERQYVVRWNGHFDCGLTPGATFVAIDPAVAVRRWTFAEAEARVVELSASGHYGDDPITVEPAPAEASEPEAPAVLWAVVGPHGAAWAVAETHEDGEDAAKRYRGVYPGEAYTVRRYRLDDTPPAVPEGMAMVDVDELLEAVASEDHERHRGAYRAIWPDIAPEDRERRRETWRERLVTHGILPEPTP